MWVIWARVTGWRYATTASTSSAAGDNRAAEAREAFQMGSCPWSGVDPPPPAHPSQLDAMTFELLGDPLELHLDRLSGHLENLGQFLHRQRLFSNEQDRLHLRRGVERLLAHEPIHCPTATARKWIPASRSGCSSSTSPHLANSSIARK